MVKGNRTPPKAAESSMSLETRCVLLEADLKRATTALEETQATVVDLEKRLAQLESQQLPPLLLALCRCFGAPASPSPPLGIIFTGAPASGKGTQAELLLESYGVVHLSTGDMLRAAAKAGTPVGLEAKEYMEKGQLVPDATIIGIVVARLHEPDCEEHGWLLDGFPRTEAQAIALREVGIVPKLVLALQVPDDELVQRVINRRMDPVTGKIYNARNLNVSEEIAARLVQRADDTEDAVRNRLATYHKNVASLAAAYPDMLSVDGTRPPDVVFADVRAIVDKAQAA